jgi:VWFA-related protein
VELTSKGQQQIFANIVDLSTLMLQARITLYSIDPRGSAEAGSVNIDYWQNFAKGITKPSQAQPGDLALQVLATQSGGLVLNASNDLTAQVQKSLRDAAVYYELSFDPPKGEHPQEYHHLEIHIAKPGLTARTRQGYYSQP